MKDRGRALIHFTRTAAGLLICVAAGALVSIAVAKSDGAGSSSAYGYGYQYCTTPTQYQYCSTTTSTTTTTTPTTTTPTGPAGQIRLADGSISIPVTSVTPPDRLVIDRVSFSPNPLRSRLSVLTGRFRVSNQANGYRVRDALVYGIALPYGQFRPAAEVTTGTDGFATIRFIPTANLHTGRNSTIQFFLRARKPGDPLLSGVSIRRLVQARVLVR